MMKQQPQNKNNHQQRRPESSSAAMAATLLVVLTLLRSSSAADAAAFAPSSSSSSSFATSRTGGGINKNIHTISLLWQHRKQQQHQHHCSYFYPSSSSSSKLHYRPAAPGGEGGRDPHSDADSDADADAADHHDENKHKHQKEADDDSCSASNTSVTSTITTTTTTTGTSSSSTAPTTLDDLLRLDVPDSILQQQYFSSPGICHWLRSFSSTECNNSKNKNSPTILSSDVEWIRGDSVASSSSTFSSGGTGSTTFTSFTSTSSSSTLGDILTISPSALIQEQLESLAGFIMTIDSNNDHDRGGTPESSSSGVWARTKFDLEYRRCLLQSFSTLLLDADDDDNYDTQDHHHHQQQHYQQEQPLAELLQHGRSNTHPLGFAVMVIPPHTQLSPQVAAAVECHTILQGTLYSHPLRLLELKTTTTTTTTTTARTTAPTTTTARRNNTPVPVRVLQGIRFSQPHSLLSRQVHHCIGTPLSSILSNSPTSQELDMVAQDISKRMKSTKTYRLWKWMQKNIHIHNNNKIHNNKSNSNNNNNSNSNHGTDTSTTSSTGTSSTGTGTGTRISHTPGSFLVHPVGSIYQYSTGDEPCLIWGLGAHLPAKFLSLE